jgi:type I restriction enzyme S subunit
MTETEVKVEIKKEGYKKTKFGLLPKDWEITQFNKIFELMKSYSFSRNDLTDNENEGDTYYIHYGDIHSKFERLILNLNDRNSAKIPLLRDSSKPEKDLVYLQEGDLIIADASEDYEGVAECIEIGKIQKGKKIIGGLHTIVARDKNGKTAKKFRSHLLKSWPVAKELKKIATGISVLGVSKGNIEKVKIPLPPLPQQGKIAEILTTWDEAISKIEKLIKAKKRYKKGLMQRLLSGKVRFSEFEGEDWVEMYLGKLVKRKKRKVPKPDNEYLSIGIRSHGKGTFQKPNKDPDDNSMTSLYKVKENDLIVNITFAWEGAIAIVKKEDEGGYVSHRFPTYEFEASKLIPEYFQYVIIQPWFVYKLGLISPGGAGRNRVLNKKDFLKLKIEIPSVSEQKAIADVLMTIDREIELLEMQLNKYQKQKKGLMQKLLTGKMRVNKVEFVDG